MNAGLNAVLAHCASLGAQNAHLMGESQEIASGWWLYPIQARWFQPRPFPPGPVRMFAAKGEQVDGPSKGKVHEITPLGISTTDNIPEALEFGRRLIAEGKWDEAD